MTRIPKDEKQRLVTRQIKVLEEHGVYPIASRVMAMMVVVRKEELEFASQLKISNEITIASRYEF